MWLVLGRQNNKQIKGFSISPPALYSWQLGESFETHSHDFIYLSLLRKKKENSESIEEKKKNFLVSVQNRLIPRFLIKEAQVS